MNETLPQIVRPGRPREYSAEQAIRDVTAVFWENGYFATTLDSLIAKAGLSRSSFYSFFGSKQRALHHVLRLHAAQIIRGLEATRRAAPDPATAVHDMARKAVDPEGGRRGCFLANCNMELAPVDPVVDGIVTEHFRLIEDQFERCYRAIGALDPAASASFALTLVLGLIARRKSGCDPKTLDAMLDRGIATTFAT
ncbi:TetR/AcrR family transcriptional regulator [Anianabacter salinae]|uniref:TetR/AcrR family transcriptional regulator n=1 Tax=Anianabacter salinae TaxID=2851023 RepID=UPI00225DD8BC|nr:TetR/AcrR family transcriptional regulator [Anianabacter salinae]MBV0914198.1 TetR/AcrR family transcriptional regulator [Anianabacter salinae]